MAYRNDDCQETDTSKGHAELLQLGNLDGHVHRYRAEMRSRATREFFDNYMKERGFK